MKTIVALCMLLSVLSAENFSFDNELEIQAGEYYRGVYKEEDESNQLSLLTYTPIVNYKSEKFDFNFIPMFTLLASNKPVFNAITGEQYQDYDFFIKSMYVKYKADKHKFLLGIFSLSYNGYLGYKNDYFERGEGLHTIIDRDIPGVMYIYDVNDDFSIKALYGGDYYNKNEALPIGGYGEHEKKDFLLISNYRKDKFRFDTTFLYQQSYEEGTHEHIGDLSALGIGLVYDDSEYSGNVFYNIFSVSRHDFHGITAEHVQKQIGNDYDIDTINNNPTFSLDPKITYGWSNLLGYRKDFEIMGTENFMNVEWFHASDGFVSANLGSIYKGDATDMFYVNDDSLSISLGHIISDTQYIKYVYSYVEFENLPALGNRADKVPVSEHLMGDTTSYTYMKIVWNIKF